MLAGNGMKSSEVIVDAVESSFPSQTANPSSQFFDLCYCPIV